MRKNDTRPYKNKVQNREVQTSKQLLTDGGQTVDASDLSLFQVVSLAIIVDEPRYGLAIKRELEEFYGQEVNHGRLYANLDELVEKGLAEKSELDKRTNEYAGTDAGQEVLEEFDGWLADRLPPKIMTDGGEPVSTATPNSSDMGAGAPDRHFGMEAMDLDDVSVSRDNGRYVITVRGPNPGGDVDGERVVDLANEMGHDILGVSADLDADELVIEVSL